MIGQNLDMKNGVEELRFPFDVGYASENVFHHSTANKKKKEKNYLSDFSNQ